MNQNKSAAFSPDHYDAIYLDTCSLMEKEFRSWLRQQLPELLKSKKQLLIPHAVAQELAYLAGGVTSNCSREAGQARELGERMVQTGIAQLCGDRSVSQQADLYLVKTASAERFQKRLAVITQDRQLTDDLNLLNRIGNAKTIHTYKLERGDLVPTGKTPSPKDGRAENAKHIYNILGL